MKDKFKILREMLLSLCLQEIYILTKAIKYTGIQTLQENNIL